MKINIAKPIKDAARNMVQFYFDTYYPDKKMEGMKQAMIRHIEHCEIEAVATPKGSSVKIKQKCLNRYRDSSRN
jgi:hypothetical protein